MKMFGVFGFFSLALIAGCASSGSVSAELPIETAFIFKADSGEETPAFRGEFQAPENRSDPDSRTLTLRYVRFAATGENPGSPIVYLAGGPGGSGIRTAKWRRFPLFMAMREFGDVIAFEQRGTGESDDTPECASDIFIPDNEALPVKEAHARLHRSVVQCRTFWEAQGVDLRGYTTVESARDLDALRAHLGAEKITLWGISYGTHLALAALKEMEPRIDRLVLASAEGLDQTVKLPSRTDAYFGRLQEVIDAQPAAKAAYPDIKELMRRVHAKLEKEPVMLQLETGDGASANYLLQKQTMQRIASGMISDPVRAVALLQMYSAVDAGEYAPAVGILQRFVRPGAPVEWSAMSLAMDVASGIGDERLARVEREAQTGLLGDLLNFPMPQLNGALADMDLGEAFRTAPESEIRALLLTGTLDGRTYPNSQQEAVAGLSNVTTVTVENAGHNLFMSSPAVTEAIQRFMRDEAVSDYTIKIDPPKFVSE
ncbi:MAG: alpha/beta fold hydrolase [Pseudomonadota bacterium]